MKISFKWDQTMQCLRVIKRPFLLSPHNVLFERRTQIECNVDIKRILHIKSWNYFLVGILKCQGYFRIRSRMKSASRTIFELVNNFDKE